jgi:adenosyl cobinamide kinase/adenosyl cobinamide phosphate guanylyltransferase
MLHFITGFHGSGKSLYAERLVASQGHRVTYVGTLPAHPVYDIIIQEHQARRPADWQLLELIGDHEADIIALTIAFTHSQSVLIDGISFYLFRIAKLTLDLPDFQRPLTAIIKTARNVSCQVVVVDNPTPRDLPIRIRNLIIYTRALILRSATSVTLVHSGIATPVTRRFALSIDDQPGNRPTDWRIGSLLT